MNLEGKRTAGLKALVARALARIPAAEFEGLPVWDNLYKPESILRSRVDSVLALRGAEDQRSRQERGRLLEQVGMALLSGVRAVTNVRSIRGPLGQHDLIAHTSHTADSQLLERVLFGKKFDVLMEAKATSDAVDTATMARLCTMLRTPFRDTKHIGIFLTLEGITGMGKTKVSDAQLTRMLFHAREGKPILVIDSDELEWLAEGGNFLELLRKKIEELENGCSLHPGEIGDTTAGPLPAHLSEVYKLCSASTRPPPSDPEPD